MNGEWRGSRARSAGRHGGQRADHTSPLRRIVAHEPELLVEACDTHDAIYVRRLRLECGHLVGRPGGGIFSDGFFPPVGARRRCRQCAEEALALMSIGGQG